MVESAREGTKWASKVIGEATQALPHPCKLKVAPGMAEVDDIDKNSGATQMCLMTTTHEIDKVNRGKTRQNSQRVQWVNLQAGGSVVGGELTFARGGWM